MQAAHWSTWAVHCVTVSPKNSSRLHFYLFTLNECHVQSNNIVVCSTLTNPVLWWEWRWRRSATSVMQEQLQRQTLVEVCSPRCISNANGVPELQGCCGIAAISSWNCWRSPPLSWAATSFHKTMQRIIIFKVFHYGRLTLANSNLTL